jgi:hypothetical protein
LQRNNERQPLEAAWGACGREDETEVRSKQKVVYVVALNLIVSEEPTLDCSFSHPGSERRNTLIKPTAT